MFALAWARLSWMRRPSYCSLSALIWNSSCLASATRVVRFDLGAVVCAALMPAGRMPEISRASAAAAPARPTAPLSLRTAMHNIGIKVGWPPTRGKFYLGVPAAAGRLLRVRLAGSGYRGRRYGLRGQVSAHPRRAGDQEVDRLQCRVW